MTQFFIGRINELSKLQDLEKTSRPKFVVITGRRRVGKSRLVREYAKNKRFICFSGVAPLKKTSAQDQRDVFAHQLYTHFNIPPFTFKNWSDAFDQLSFRLSKDEQTIILFDEISWMAHKDPLFISKLKNWWDMKLQDFPHLTLILCGSVSIWIEKNIIKSTALFGRISLKITLEELSLAESYSFLKKVGFHGSDYEILKILSVTGGIPWYLEQINPHYDSDKNIQNLFFSKDGLFYDEYTHIFHDLFSNKSIIYKSIIECLVTGMKTLKQLKEETEYRNSGSFSTYLKNLVISGFVDEHIQWSLKSETPSKVTLFRLKDNYLRFYLHYLDKQKRLSGSSLYEDLESLPGWETIMGLQVEALLLNNRKKIHQMLNLSHIIASGPYHQNSTKVRKGCQIDYLIQTTTQTLYVCEFKFSKRTLGLEVLEQMENKKKSLEIPRGRGICLVLIHTSGVTKALDASGSFYRIIDIRDFFKPPND